MQDTMSNKEAIDMMLRCRNEIVHLKAVIAQLQPKADAYDNIAMVLHLLPKPSQGYGEDLVWIIDKRVKELTPKEPPPPDDIGGVTTRGAG